MYNINLQLKYYVIWMVIECRIQKLNKFAQVKEFSLTLLERSSHKLMEIIQHCFTPYTSWHKVLDIFPDKRYSHFETLHADLSPNLFSVPFVYWGQNSANSLNFVKVKKTKIYLITTGYIKIDVLNLLLSFTHPHIWFYNKFGMLL